MNAISRMIDEMGPDFPQCVVELIDSLRNMIRADKELTDDLLREGSITIEDARDIGKAQRLARELLAALEQYEVSCDLHGLINQRGRP